MRAPSLVLMAGLNQKENAVSYFNHIGLAVEDTDRSRRFYEGLLGFVFTDQIPAAEIPNEFLVQLLGVDNANLTATHLKRDGLILELLRFDREGNSPRRERGWTEPGLTHISLGVEDLADVLSKTEEFGGTVLYERQTAGTGALILDPDGQIVELIVRDSPWGELARRRNQIVTK